MGVEKPYYLEPGYEKAGDAVRGCPFRRTFVLLHRLSVLNQRDSFARSGGTAFA